MKHNEEIVTISKRLLQLVEAQNVPSAIDHWECLRMHEGTNNIFKVVSKSLGEKYAVKIYNKRSKINHTLEHKIIEYLAKQGRHPAIIYRDDDCRIEELIEDANMSIFELRAMPKLVQVVELIASLHNDEQLRSAILPSIEDKRPFVLAVNESWLNSFNEVYEEVQKNLKNTKYEAFANSLDFLLTEDFQDLFRSLIPEKSELVLAHNDISTANLLCTKNDDKTEMYLIDYEYCRINFRGYDLAVLFEDIITDYNYPEYPSFQMHHQLAITQQEENLLLKHYVTTRGQKTEGVEAEVKRLRQEVISLRIIFQLAGALWGLTTHDWTKGNFDENNCWRVEYARQRWNIFLEYIKKYYYDDQTLITY
eukprot:TRINITY_DN14093_c0_g1_i1.p1 TRINITY_DN14093_c0_g1~~TRINITY_DN14093_c0_g1_i1.p1  ORF type:complete len:365 (+),score=115.26 TRINITY_DN14093_c0_g1_i1:92-1186(+)